MNERKKSGSYYTPAILSDFLTKHIFERYVHSSYIKILEPSVGDGQFLMSLFKHRLLENIQHASIHINETDTDELLKSCNLYELYKLKHTKLYPTAIDFLDYNEENKNFSLVIGNPPYINKTYLTSDQITKCKKICQKSIPSFGETKNIWPSFLIKSIQKLAPDGVLCFVLPAEILQVKYTKEIRKYIIDSFDRVEVFAFNELIFSGVEQDVIVLIGIKRTEKSQKGVSFYQVNRLEDLKIPGYIEKHSNVHRTTLDKWTNYILEDSELNMIDELKHRTNIISHYCRKVEVGIVTAANNFFITNQETINRNHLRNVSVPILQKSSSVRCGLTLTYEELEYANYSGKAVNLILLPNKPKQKLCKSYQKYIGQGEEQSIHLRYKMKKREHWFHIPSVWNSEGMFAKRSHLFPKVIINEANVCATDAFYRINMKEGYHIKDLAFSFYNTLTFVLAELEGRFYGGGVLELTPSEFKNLSIPYFQNAKTRHLEYLNTILKKKPNTEDFLDYTDSILLIDNLGFSSSEIMSLRDIHHKLVGRRLKRTVVESEENVSSNMMLI